MASVLVFKKAVVWRETHRLTHPYVIVPMLCVGTIKHVHL